MKKSVLSILYSLIISVILSACVSAPNVSEPPRRFFWPPQPDEPKIEWIAAYYGDSNIKENTLMSKIVGEDSNIRLKRPVAVAGDSNGRFVVSDQELMQVILFDLNKHEASSYGSGSGGENSIEKPSGVSVDSDGKFYVADTKTFKIHIIDKDNKVIQVIDMSDKLKSIGGIFADSVRGRLLVTDPNNSKVLIYSLAGKYISTVNGNGYYSYPNAVAVESNGTIDITDAFNVRIIRFSADGAKFLSFFGERGDSPGSLSLISGIAVDSEDHIYVTDAKLHTTTIFDTVGNSLMVIGGKHSVLSGNLGIGGLLIPQGISIDKNDQIYIADSQNARVQVFQYLNKKYLQSHPIQPVLQ